MARIEFDIERLNRYFIGEYSEEDESYVDEVFCDINKERDLKGLLSRQFNELVNEDQDEKDLNPILYRIHYNINSRLSEKKVWSFENILKWPMRMTGVLMLPLVIFLGIQTYKEAHQKKELWVEIKSPAWTKTHFSLPDGTTVWLSSNSSVKYNGNFNTERQITLKGEAYFDVFKDQERPFKVTTNEVVLKVLGTRFNIASYDDDKNVEVVLEEGKLEFSDKEMKKSYTMRPNDLLTYDKSLRNFSTEVVQPKKYLAWTEGKLVFRNDPMDIIARRLERWYNIDVEVYGNNTEDLRLRATFIDEGLEEVLDLMKRSLPLDYKIEKGDIKPDETYSKKKVIITFRPR